MKINLSLNIKEEVDLEIRRKLVEEIKWIWVMFIYFSQ